MQSAEHKQHNGGQTMDRLTFNMHILMLLGSRIVSEFGI